MISDADLLLWTRAESADLPTLRRLEKAAIAYIEGRTGRYYGIEDEIVENLTWQGWPLALANEPAGGEITLESLSSGAYTEVDAASYSVVGRFIFWETSQGYSPLTMPSRYRATYDAGYTGTGDVWAAPQDIQQAVLLLVSHWNENREAVGTVTEAVQMGVDSLLASHTLVTV